jgi:hypothetical protein
MWNKRASLYKPTTEIERSFQPFMEMKGTIMENPGKTQLRIYVKSLYDLQKLRIQTGNRVAINFRTKLGQEAGQELTEAKAKQIINSIKVEYKRLTDGIVSLNDKGILKSLNEKQGVITNLVEFRLIQSYINLLHHEESGFRSIEKLLEDHAVWNEYLVKVKGIGLAMGAVIISELDPYKARHASSFWKYAGLDVAEDGKGRSRRPEHLIRVHYVDKKGNPAERNSITFSPFLKSKLLGVLGSSFLRASNDVFAPIYYQYKHRLVNHAVYKDVSDGHRHNMARRYMVKQFLVELWTTWRTLEGLPVDEPYYVAKLGMTAHGT